MFISEHTVTREGLWVIFVVVQTSETVIHYLTNYQAFSELEHLHFLFYVAKFSLLFSLSLLLLLA